MHRLFQSLACLLVMSLSLVASASPTVKDLIRRLEGGVDFRVRVQSALDLGKTKSTAARRALERALDDENAAVRAAAAAALKVLGDKRALPALLKRQKDRSPAVRSQIKNTITALRASNESKTKKKAHIVVQLGKVRNRSKSRVRTVVKDVERASRKKFGDLPGVVVVDGPNEAKKNGHDRLPLVMVTTQVKKLDRSREGSTVAYSASVEFVMHKMPGQTLKGVVVGSAKASGSAPDKEALADLRRSALEAAIASALRRAPEALRAATE